MVFFDFFTLILKIILIFFIIYYIVNVIAWEILMIF